jgi:hypothetical protein
MAVKGMKSQTKNFKKWFIRIINEIKEDKNKHLTELQKMQGIGPEFKPQ